MRFRTMYLNISPAQAGYIYQALKGKAQAEDYEAIEIRAQIERDVAQWFSLLAYEDTLTNRAQDWLDMWVDEWVE